MEYLGKRYGFSDRLRAIIQDTPISAAEKQDKHEKRYSNVKEIGKDFIHIVKGDLEKATPSIDSQSTVEKPAVAYEPSHYGIVNQMINYHAIDFGDQCKSVTFNVKKILTFLKSYVLERTGCINRARKRVPPMLLAT